MDAQARLEGLVGHPLRIQRVALSTLHTDPANARSHPERNLDAIKDSLRRFGQVEPLVVQEKTGRVIGGNGRVTAMRALGWTEVDVVEIDISQIDATALGITLNRTSDLADWDEEVLGKLLTSLRDAGAIDAIGFAPLEVDDLLTKLQGDLNLDGSEDSIPAAAEDAVTRRGDLWVLGSHRLLCGDSAVADDVDRLVAGQPIHLLNTDPVYNVKVEPRSNNAIRAGLSSFTTTHHQGLDLARDPSKATPTHDKLRAKDRALTNDSVSDEEFARMLRSWFGNAARVLLPGRGFYVWGGYSNLANYPSALAECGLYFSQGIVWNKLHPVLGRKDFLGAFELAFYGWREGAAHEFFGPNNATDLWEVKKLHHAAMVHLTEKPCELATRAIQYSSRIGENVLDLFGGSGSTLIAAELASRKAFLMEIDELYADVIVRRWQEKTGKEATLEATGQTFAAVQAERGVS